MITRLRPAYTEEQLQTLYATPHEHSHWVDHQVRVQVTLGVARIFEGLESAADLSCGDGYIIDNIDALRKYKGDFAPGYQFTGPIEQTIDEIPIVDLFVCAGTIEHIDDPVNVLKKIRSKTQRLILSTPNGETNPDLNLEHYWGWNREGMHSLLKEAGFDPVVYSSLELCDYEYDYQIWACK